MWLSASADLHLDARRDLDDIHATDIECYKNPPVKAGKLDAEDGVLFSTYAGLISTTRKGANRKPLRKIDLIIAWCCGGNGRVRDKGSSNLTPKQELEQLMLEFDGCIMFDECHKAKNLAPPAGSGKPTQVGLAVLELQQRLPRARIVYCSATGCSEPTNMAYMVRLGLWGTNTAFPGGFQEFRKACELGGVGMM